MSHMYDSTDISGVMRRAVAEELQALIEEHKLVGPKVVNSPDDLKAADLVARAIEKIKHAKKAQVDKTQVVKAQIGIKN